MWLNFEHLKPDLTKLKHRYGLLAEDFVRMLRKQNIRCAICDVEFRPDQKPHVDHSHNCGTVRGLLCNNCNIGLGHFIDSPEILRRAADYLEGKNETDPTTEGIKVPGAEGNHY